VNFSENIKNYEITNKDHLFELAKIAAAQYPISFSRNIQRFKITDENKLFEIAKIVANLRGEAVFENIEHFKITDKDQLFELTKIAAIHNGWTFSANIRSYRIQDQDQLFEIAKIVAPQHGSNISKYIHNYSITDPNRRFEIAKIIAAQSESDISEYIQNYRITDQNQRFEIAKIAAAQSESNISFYIRKYQIQDPNLRLEIAKIAVFQNLWETYRYIENYSLQITLPNAFRDLHSKSAKLEIPMMIENEEEKKFYASQIQSLAKEFEVLAREEFNIPNLDLFFKDLPKIDNLRQRLKTVDCVDGFLFYSLLDSDFQQLLRSGSKNTTLVNIAKIPNSDFQEEVTKTLFSLYLKENEKQKEKWLSFRETDANPLLQLFCAKGGIDPNLLLPLKAKYYQNMEILNPILEMTHFLCKDQNLTPEDRSKFLKFLFSEDRTNQGDLVNAARNLLCFRKGEILKNINFKEDLLKAQETLFKEIFSVTNDKGFLDTFQTKGRIPGALFTYAAKLQILPPDQKKPLFSLLAEFVSGVLSNEFPGSRYNLSKNQHLKQIFENNAPLLELWKTPLPSQPVSIDSDKTKAAPLPILKQALFRSIGEHLKEYPYLIQMTQWEDSTWNQEIEKAQKTLIDEKKQGIKDKNYVRKLDLQLKCLQLFTAKGDVYSLITLLVQIKDLAPSEQFKKEVEVMIQQITPSKTSKESYSFEESDAWEDLLLMGTEVRNSCQTITGSVYYNKCLLAYILDGKNKLMLIKDSDKKIVGRVILRILWDKATQKPVLFMERLYKQRADQPFEQPIFEACKAKAKQMGLPLLASRKDYPGLTQNQPIYPNSIQSLEGPAPYEYVDALGDIQLHGAFDVPGCYIVQS